MCAYVYVYYAYANDMYEWYVPFIFLHKEYVPPERAFVLTNSFLNDIICCVMVVRSLYTIHLTTDLYNVYIYNLYVEVEALYNIIFIYITVNLGYTQ